MDYKALACRITVRELSGADYLQIGTCGRYQVIVGKDVRDGDMGVFFETDGQISADFAARNDLIRRKNEDGTPAGGMFGPNRKVRCIKLRGAKSEGFWIPINAFDYAGKAIKEGDQFNYLGEFPICNKFVTQATLRASGGRKILQRDNKMFHKHVDTYQFKRSYKTIPIGSVCYITEKLHGTSCRVALVLEDEPQKWWESLLCWPVKRSWKTLVGSRNQVLQNRTGPGFYGGEEFRLKAVDGISLHKGECIYGELVGYTETGAPIMGTHSVNDKKLMKKIGNDKIVYSYGCNPGQCKLYVYRITQVNEDGHATELSWPQVRQRCKGLGLLTVPEVNPPVIITDKFTVEDLNDTVQRETEAEDGTALLSSLDSRHILEGVVVRYESENGFGFMKNKAYAFLEGECAAKDDDNYVDAEESA